MKTSNLKLYIPMVLLFTLSGCATFHSEIEGSSGLDAMKTPGLDPVDVLFVSRHLVQTRGLDAIPKLQNQWQILKGFDDILLDATGELSNLNRYASYTEFSSDMSDPKRIALKDSLLANYKLRIVMEFRVEKSFSKYFLGGIASALSFTIIPIPYTREFYLNVDVYDSLGRFAKSYKRSATTSKWVEILLFPVYPFHTEMRKVEEIYVAFLHDVFREIENDQILRYGTND
ncbi:MAG: hypothetical protein K9N35_12435 [Candidatus Marinimicrobia bacterium]|nr:hypothetical protein [Candidatus Neomarinimicrobiota bacterium]